MLAICLIVASAIGNEPKAPCGGNVANKTSNFVDGRRNRGFGALKFKTAHYPLVIQMIAFGQSLLAHGLQRNRSGNSDLGCLRNPFEPLSIFGKKRLITSHIRQARIAQGLS
jgi:hypothetical protein